jgi:hypothetical protein
MARFSIMVTEYGADREIELCQLEGNPEPTVEGLKAKTLMVHLVGSKSRRRSRIPKYTNIRVVDREVADAQA